MKNLVRQQIRNAVIPADCDNCAYKDFELNTTNCDECRNDYCNWKLNLDLLETLVNSIDSEYKQIIDYLLDFLEDEHMGVRDQLELELRQRWDMVF